MTDRTVKYESRYRPGSLATLCALQSAYYARQWGFDHRYEAVVSAGVGEFLTRYDPDKDLILIAVCGDQTIGGIVIDGGEDGSPTARLRWFIISQKFRGHGIGKTLIEKAMQFVEERKYESVFLTTFDGLDPARRLYETAGFHLIEEEQKSTWGKAVLEQRFEFVSGNI